MQKPLNVQKFRDLRQPNDMSSNSKKLSINVSTTKKAAPIDSGVLPPRYQPPPQPKTAFPLVSNQDGASVVTIGDSGKQFQTVAEIDRSVLTNYNQVYFVSKLFYSLCFIPIFICFSFINRLCISMPHVILAYIYTSCSYMAIFKL